jgi:hypothetical protein
MDYGFWIMDSGWNSVMLRDLTLMQSETSP